MYYKATGLFSGVKIMAPLNKALLMMSLQIRLITLRKAQGLSQQKMAAAIGIHVNSLKKYESGQTQPSLEGLKKIALSLHVSTDFLLFDEHERGPSDEFKRQFEALSQFDDEDTKVAKALLDSLILKHNAKQAFVDQLKE